LRVEIALCRGEGELVTLVPVIREPLRCRLALGFERGDILAPGRPPSC